MIFGGDAAEQDADPGVGEEAKVRADTPSPRPGGEAQPTQSSAAQAQSDSAIARVVRTLADQTLPSALAGVRPALREMELLQQLNTVCEAELEGQSARVQQLEATQRSNENLRSEIQGLLRGVDDFADAVAQLEFVAQAMHDLSVRLERSTAQATAPARQKPQRRL